MEYHPKKLKINNSKIFERGFLHQTNSRNFLFEKHMNLDMFVESLSELNHSPINFPIRKNMNFNTLK